jgi:3-oxoacyl-[acyl-carrier protein] reductase
VTGAGRGIGRATAEALIAAGHTVVGVDIEPDLFTQGDTRFASTISLDLADVEQTRRLVPRIEEEYGRLDILVNNAAILIVKPIPDYSLDDFERTVAVNLRAVFLLCQAAAPRMAERGYGRIINLGSIGARTGGYSDSAIYNCTKAAVVAFTKAVARNYAKFGVTANAVAPGWVETFMTSHHSPAERAAYMDDIPIGRGADPSEIAAVIAFLATDGAGYVNGATVDVNGGWLMP